MSVDPEAQSSTEAESALDPDADDSQLEAELGDGGRTKGDDGFVLPGFG